MSSPCFSSLAALAIGMSMIVSSPAHAVLAQQAYVKAGNPQNAAQFGRSVAISGNTMVIGANQENTGAVKSGAAYVFVRNGDTWTQQAFLKAANAQANDEFGISVAVSGDTIVVGAWNEDGGIGGTGADGTDNTAGNSGAAYVFTRSGGAWTQQAYLKALYPGNDDYFGLSVAVSGETIVVGASNEDSNASGVNGDQANDSRVRSGAAYVYTRSGTAWSQQAFLKAGNPDMNDYFGNAVALSLDTIVVGSFFESSNATTINGNGTNNLASNSGAAYVFVRSGSTWTQQAYLKASNSGVDDLFGSSVAVHGDTIVVGAPGEASAATTVNGNGADNTAAGAGAAYVYVRSGTAWTQQAYLKASNAQANDHFGDAVAISLDAVAVGAPREYSNATGIGGNEANNSNFFTGAVYLYSRAGTTWTKQAYVKASNSNAGDEFGDRLAMSADTLVAGAIKESSSSPGINGVETNNSMSAAGAAYVFTGVPAAAAAPIRVTSVSKSSNTVTILFSSAAGLGAAGWQVYGSANLQAFPDVMTSSTTFTELTAGHYRAIVNVTGKPAAGYFLRIAR